MSVVYNCSIPKERDEGLIAASAALKSGQCIVMPTDTVYGIAADAFSVAGVAVLLAAKGRGRQMPPPVLIAATAMMDALACNISDEARALAGAFWPGALTLILQAQPSLRWDLGKTSGTVALRVPDDDCARQLLELSGPLAVSSANRTGQEAATTISSAREQLQEAVGVYLDAGLRPASGNGTGQAASTIVEATHNPLVVVREGRIGINQLRDVVPSVIQSRGGGAE